MCRLAFGAAGGYPAFSVVGFLDVFPALVKEGKVWPVSVPCSVPAVGSAYAANPVVIRRSHPDADLRLVASLIHRHDFRLSGRRPCRQGSTFRVVVTHVIDHELSMSPTKDSSRGNYRWRRGTGNL